MQQGPGNDNREEPNNERGSGSTINERPNNDTLQIKATPGYAEIDANFPSKLSRHSLSLDREARNLSEDERIITGELHEVQVVPEGTYAAQEIDVTFNKPQRFFEWEPKQSGVITFRCSEMDNQDIRYSAKLSLNSSEIELKHFKSEQIVDYMKFIGKGHQAMLPTEILGSKLREIEGAEELTRFSSLTHFPYSHNAGELVGKIHDFAQDIGLEITVHGKSSTSTYDERGAVALRKYEAMINGLPSTTRTDLEFQCTVSVKMPKQLGIFSQPDKIIIRLNANQNDAMISVGKLSESIPTLRAEHLSQISARMNMALLGVRLAQK